MYGANRVTYIKITVYIYIYHNISSCNLPFIDDTLINCSVRVPSGPSPSMCYQRSAVHFQRTPAEHDMLRRRACRTKSVQDVRKNVKVNISLHRPKVTKTTSQNHQNTNNSWVVRVLANHLIFFLDQFKLKPMVTWGSPIWTFSLTTSATSRHLTSTGSKPGIWEKSATSTWRSAHWENRRYLWFIGPHKIAKLVYKWLISMVCGRYNELVNGDYHGYKHLLKIWIKHYN